MSILSRIVKLFGCASGPSRLEQEQECMRIEADMKKRRENRPELLKKRIANYTAQLEKIQEDDNKTKQLEENPLNLEEIKLITEGEPQGKSDSKILPTSDVKRQAPLARNTGNKKGQAPLAPINTDNNKGQDKSTQIPTSHNKGQRPTASDKYR